MSLQEPDVHDAFNEAIIAAEKKERDDQPKVRKLFDDLTEFFDLSGMPDGKMVLFKLFYYTTGVLKFEWLGQADSKLKVTIGMEFISADHFAEVVSKEFGPTAEVKVVSMIQQLKDLGFGEFKIDLT